MEPDTSDDSARFSFWPALTGFLVAALIVLVMFALATGIR